MTRLYICFALLCIFAFAASARAGDVLVTKVAETFDSQPWVVDVWSKAKGQTQLVADAPPDTGSKNSLEAEARFGGQGFEWFAVHPPCRWLSPAN